MISCPLRMTMNLKYQVYFNYENGYLILLLRSQHLINHGIHGSYKAEELHKLIQVDLISQKYYFYLFCRILAEQQLKYGNLFIQVSLFNLYFYINFKLKCCSFSSLLSLKEIVITIISFQYYCVKFNAQSYFGCYGKVLQHYFIINFVIVII